MDGYEATRIVFQRIQNLDPENASQIMGLLLIQDHGEKEMIRLAFGPESLVHSVILKARKELALSSSPSSPSTLFSRQSSLSSSSRLGFPRPPPVNVSSSQLNPASVPFYGNGVGGGDGGHDLIDDLRIQDQLSFLNDNISGLDTLPSSTGAAVESVLFPSCWSDSMHHRSCSFNDALASHDLNSGLGWRPCQYYAKGFCRNGTNCTFVHGGDSDCCPILASSPNSSKMETMDCHELLRSNSLQQHQQRLAAASQLLSSASSYPYSPKRMNFLVQQQQSDSQRAAALAAALMMGEDMLKFGRSRSDRNDLVNPASRQIYLTFPADSTFREEDVSNYFSIYGPVQDVRIPYQQKRMFGFVTFLYSETVKIILAKGNPHFVCDARVLVKPYKEKGKASDKKQQQLGDGGDFSPCVTPTSLDSRDPSDRRSGVTMFCNNQDTLWRRKIEEQTDLQNALEQQSRRLASLQLLGSKKNNHQRAFSTGTVIASPPHSPSIFSRSIAFPFHHSPEVPQENCSSPLPAASLSAAPEKQQPNADPEKECTTNEENGTGKEISHVEDNNLQESLEHNLPDSLFTSPIKGTGEYSSFISDAETTSSTAKLITSVVSHKNSTPDISSFKKCQRSREGFEA